MQHQWQARLAEAALQELSDTKPRPHLTQTLSTWSLDPDAFAAELEEIEQTAADGNGFRWHAPSTQSRQDRVLREYRCFTVLTLIKRGQGNLLRLGDDLPEDVNDHVLFPNDPDQMIEYVVNYVTMCTLKCQPHDYKRRGIRAGTIWQRRLDLLFWICRKVAYAPRKSIIFRKTTEAVNYIHQRRRAFEKSETERLYLGRDELIQLIDYDIEHTHCFAYAEQHHLAWIIGLTCGVRPGSLTETKGRRGIGRYLSWRDVNIIRRSERTNDFIVELTFKHLKTNTGIPDKSIRYHELRMKVRSPAAVEQIGLSIPLRIIAILLRRGLLQDHDSIPSVLHGNERYVQIKSDALDLPVFVKGRSAGWGMAIDQPIGPGGLTRYIRERAQWLGYPPGACMYSWRAKAGTNVARIAGVDEARKFLAHSPDSRTFEEHYDQGIYDLDVVGIAIEGKTSLTTELSDVDSVALNRARLLKQSIDREILLREFVKNHASVRAARLQGSQAVAAQRKRVRLLGLRAILATERELQMAQLTVDEFNRRKRELNQSSKLFEMIRSAIERNVPDRDNVHEIDGEEVIDEDDDMIDSRDDVAADVKAARECEDIEQTYGIDLEAEVTEDRPSSGGASDASICTIDVRPYELCADSSTDWNLACKTFLEILLEFSRKEAENPKSDIPCPLCEKDSMIPEEDRSKRWASYAKLLRHLDSDVHCGYKTFRRRMLAEVDDKETVSCPYGCGDEWSVAALLKHLKLNSRRQGATYNVALHDELREADGWDDEEFYPKKTRTPKHLLLKRHLQERQSSNKRRRYDTSVSELTAPVQGCIVEMPSLGSVIQFGRVKIPSTLVSPGITRTNQSAIDEIILSTDRSLSVYAGVQISFGPSSLLEATAQIKQIPLEALSTRNRFIVNKDNN